MIRVCLLAWFSLALLATVPGWAQQAEVPQEAAPASAAVTVRGETLFIVRTPIGMFSVAERTQAIEGRVESALRQPELATAQMRFETLPQSVDVFLGSQFLTSVTDADARPLGRTRRQLAADYAVAVQRLVSSTLQQQSVRGLLFAAGRCLVAIAVAFAAVIVMRRFVIVAARRLTRLAQRKVGVVRLAGYTLFSPEHAIPLTLRAVKSLHLVLVVVVVIVGVDYCLQQFVWTRGIANSTARAGFDAVRWVLGGMVGFIPNLVVLTVLGFAVRYILKALKVVVARWAAFDQQRFPPEWVQPTYQIIRLIVIALAVVIAFPYLPGSGSKAFQGVSVFVGVLLSLGSSAAIGNMIAGLVLIYMRAVRPGDRVKIADTVGDVISCDMLALRLRTIKNVDITIPNALALSNHIINFSTQAAEGRLILHTAVTIGYDAEWRTVQQLLVAAALATPDIEPTPAPFVLQTALDDFYVAYEINAYTRNASAMARIYSDLHANIQDKFNEGGVEILSPHYAQLRDGNRTAVPDPYLPKDYHPATFGLSVLRPKARTP